jgi:predicted RNA-binding Zn-ribbon protein involved in translation (DUF1610 family)
MAEKGKAKTGKLDIKRCSSCGKRIEAEDMWVEFRCPACEKQGIIRCEKCKATMVQYECSKCGFVGP